MLPKMIPFSVDATLTLALMFVKSCGLMTTGCGFSTNFKSPDRQILGEKISCEPEMWNDAKVYGPQIQRSKQIQRNITRIDMLQYARCLSKCTNAI